MHPKVSREDEESPVQPIDSSGSSSPSPVLTLFEGSHIHHGRGVFQSPPSNPLPNGLPLSAAQSRVGSPTYPAALPHHHFTLFNTRFALRKSFGSLADSGGGVEGFTLAASGFNCDSNGFIRGPVVKVEEDGNGVLLPEKKKKKKKGAPAKNLMAERRRRKKLNDKLLMLRSVVPNITKMDKTSILGDAIQYMEEMMQKINDLQNELEPLQSPATSQSTSLAASSVTHAASLPPAREKFPAMMKDLCPISLPSPNGQPARIEVRAKGRAMSIHMCCSKRPGLLLSITRALESVGLDIQNAVFSSFNGFVLDIYRAECKEGQDVEPEQIKALLLESIGFTTP